MFHINYGQYKKFALKLFWNYNHLYLIKKNNKYQLKICLI